MDIKNTLSKYEITVGKKVNLDNIKRSIQILLKNKVEYEFRTTVVKEFHNVERIENIKNWLNDPKHYYLQKFRLSENCINQNLHALSKEELIDCLNAIKPYVTNVSIRGVD